MIKTINYCGNKRTIKNNGDYSLLGAEIIAKIQKRFYKLTIIKPSMPKGQEHLIDVRFLGGKLSELISHKFGKNFGFNILREEITTPFRLTIEQYQELIMFILKTEPEIKAVEVYF